MYNQKVLDIFVNPRNAGGLQGSNGIGKASTLSGSDVIKLYFKIDEAEVVSEAKFKTYGCVGAIVCSSVVTELVINKTVEEVLSITANDIIEVLGGLPDEKIYCANLAEEAIKNTIQEYYKKKEKEEKQKAE